MATNAKKKAADDGEKVDAEELLRDAKYGEVESSQETDETSETETPEEESQDSEESAETSAESTTGDQEGQTDEVATEESEEGDETPPDEESSFVKEFPGIAGDTWEEYAKNLEPAYKNSTTEALRLKGLAEGKEEASEETGPVDPRLLYIDRIVNQDIKKTYEVFRKEYPQVDDPEQYQKFVTEVQDLSTFYQEKKGVALTAEEVYPRAAANLGWEATNKVDDSDKLAVALKDKAAASKNASATKPKIKSTVTDGEIAVAKQMWGAGMSDSKIREELEKVKI